MITAERAVAGALGVVTAVGVYFGIGFAADQSESLQEKHEKEAQQIADCAATLGSQAVWRVTFPEACEPVIPRMTYERRTDALVTNGEERTKTTYRLPARSTIAALQPDFKRINDDHENVTKGRSVARLVVTPISGICMAAVLEANTNIPANIIRSVRGRTSRARPRQ
jgi:hypothetical protein